MTLVKSIPNSPHSSTVRLFFGLTIGLGAGLLFWQELLIGRQMLPKFGGVPAVWLVSLAMFQTILLLAYALAHGMRRWSRGKILALLLVFAAMAAAQQVFAPALIASDNITPVTVIVALLGMAGCSLFLLSMISPVMQGLYARLPQPDAHDPYFFYSASNLGSFAGLLLFPLVLEPFFGVQFSQNLWLIVGALFIACLIGSILTMKKMSEVKEEIAPATDARKRWPLWLFYAFLPSALSFSATSHLINDIAPVPLLSMVPLALYLLTFILAFGKDPKWQQKLIAAQPFLVAFYVYRLAGSGLKLTQGLDLVIVLIAFFVTALRFHRQLANSRPPAGDLTFYYLIVALGGALGAIVNVTIIPFVMPLPFEFAAFLLISLLPSFKDDISKLGDTRAWKINLIIRGLVLATLVLSVMQGGDDRLHYITLPLLVISLVAMTLRPAFLGIFSTILIVIAVMQMPHTVALQRDFFGVKRIVEGPYDDGKIYRTLYHGSTFHGGQQLTPVVSLEPLFYYGKGGGFYDSEEVKQPQRMAIIGMGAGSNACLHPKGGSLTFFEIDPGMVDLAKKYFTFLQNCPANIVVGDGRLTLARDTSRYDMLLVDAFSSDAIPVHLLTHEAFDIYRQHLADGGLLVIHISNRYLDLRPVTLGGAEAEGMHAAHKYFTPDPEKVDLAPSEYVAFSPDPTVINRLIAEKGWETVDVKPILWTDDKLSLVPVLKIFRKTTDAQTH